MKLVEDWRNWWKWHSTYVFAVLAVLPEVWINSTLLQALLPLGLVAKIAPFIALIGFALRIRDQVRRIPPAHPVEPKDGERLPPA